MLCTYCLLILADNHCIVYETLEFEDKYEEWLSITQTIKIYEWNH